jgi:hypothetical protein
MALIRRTPEMNPCGSSLPDLEVPMINTMVTCLGIEHRKLNYLAVQLAFAATTLVRDPASVTANLRALEVWDEIRRDLWSHVEIEDELVFSWGEAHHATSAGLLDDLKIERQQMRELIAALPAWSSGVNHQPLTAVDQTTFAQTMLALARMLDSHVERYDGEVLPSILRALFHR